MAKRVLLVRRFQLLAMAATLWVVNIAAFQPPVLSSRIGSSSTGIKHLPSLNACGIAKASVVSLNSADNDDPPDIVVVKNVKEDWEGEVSTDDKVDDLLALLDSVPSNLPTSRSMTDTILSAVQNLEAVCPTPEDKVLSELSGNWELLWTAQDKTSEQYLKGGLANVIINPLENQSYANNPFLGGTTFLFDEEEKDGGRANPVLPREIQDVLERTGILEASGGTKLAPIRSSQGIDIKRKRVRNVVNVQFKKPFAIKGSLIVDVDFSPNQSDARRIDVKFDSCRFMFQNNVDRRFPLGIFGPRGWLRTGYVDDRIRITRGHKGSVFILSRTAKRRSV